MELIAVIALLAMSGALFLWQRAEKRIGILQTKLTGAQLVAEAGTFTSKVLAQKIRDRERTIANLEIYIADIAGTDGLVDLLNGSVLPDSEGGDDPSGMSN